MCVELKYVSPFTDPARLASPSPLSRLITLMEATKATGEGADTRTRARSTSDNTMVIRLPGLRASLEKIKYEWEPPIFRGKLQDYAARRDDGMGLLHANTHIRRNTHTHAVDCCVLLRSLSVVFLLHGLEEGGEG